MARNDLIPFDNTTEAGRERARQAGRKGGLTRARNAAARKAREAEAQAAAAEQGAILVPMRRPDEYVDVMRQAVEGFKRDELGPQAAAAAQFLIGRILAGDIEVGSRDIAPLIDTLVTITRLEEGQSTSNHVHLRVDGADAITHLRQLRAQGQGHNGADESTPQPIEATASKSTTQGEQTPHLEREGGQGGTPGSTTPDDV